MRCLSERLVGILGLEFSCLTLEFESMKCLDGLGGLKTMSVVCVVCALNV